MKLYFEKHMNVVAVCAVVAALLVALYLTAFSGIFAGSSDSQQEQASGTAVSDTFIGDTNVPLAENPDSVSSESAAGSPQQAQVTQDSSSAAKTASVARKTATTGRSGAAVSASHAAAAAATGKQASASDNSSYAAASDQTGSAGVAEAGNAQPETTGGSDNVTAPSAGSGDGTQDNGELTTIEDDQWVDIYEDYYDHNSDTATDDSSDSSAAASDVQ